MASITGFGGIFLRADDPKALYQWYERHLGVVKADGSFAFPGGWPGQIGSFRITPVDRTAKSFLPTTHNNAKGAPG